MIHAARWWGPRQTIDLRFQSAYIRVANAWICIIQSSFQMSSDMWFKKFLKKGLDKSHYISVLCVFILQNNKLFFSSQSYTLLLTILLIFLFIQELNIL